MDVKPVVKQEQDNKPNYVFPQDEEEQLELPVDMQRNTWAVKVCIYFRLPFPRSFIEQSLNGTLH